MLPYPYRLPALLVREVLRSGHHTPSPPLQLIHKPAVTVAQFAVIVPKRIDKRATARNRQRRLIQESLRLLMPGIKPIQAVIMLQRPFTIDTIDEAKVLIEGLLKKAGVY